MYLLDTNICIFLIKNKNPYLKKKIFNCKKEELFLSSITIAELEYGVSKSQCREKNRRALLDFCADFINIIDFTAEDTETYGMIRAYLEKKGNIIGPYDMQIAAHAYSMGAVLISRDQAFGKIPGLDVQDWIAG